jgi:hypothetical protein
MPFLTRAATEKACVVISKCVFQCNLM